MISSSAVTRNSSRVFIRLPHAWHAPSTPPARPAAGPAGARRPPAPAARSRGSGARTWRSPGARSEEHTSELQSLMRISYAVFCLKKKIKHYNQREEHQNKQNMTELAVEYILHT